MHMNEIMDHCVVVDLCKKTAKGISSTSSSSSGSLPTGSALAISEDPCTSAGTCKQTIKGIPASSSSSSEDASNAVKVDTNPCASVGRCKETINEISTSSSSSTPPSEEEIKFDTQRCVADDPCKQTVKGIPTSSSSSSGDSLHVVELDVVRNVYKCKKTMGGILSTSSSSTTSTENLFKLEISPCMSAHPCKQTNVKGISSSSGSTSSTEFNDVLGPTKLEIALTDKGFLSYKTHSKRKLLKLLTNRLEECIRAQENLLKTPTDTTNERRLWITIQSGLYSTNVMKVLLEKGMSVHTIIKAMKLGLINLTYCELVHFKHFKVEPYILEEKIMWSKMLSDELISNLKTTSLTDSECWEIIVLGLRFQCSRILCHLMLSGIDVPGVLSWQSPINTASPKIIKFLKDIGIDGNLLELIEKYGIDDETIQMLIDFGFHEFEDSFLSLEDIICNCSLTTLESQKISLDTRSICEMSDLGSSSTPTITSNYLHPCICQCHLGAQKNTVEELTVQRNDYLRRNVMVPLAWAMSKTLTHNPTNPLHYIMYQLLRWKDNITETKKNGIYEAIALATIEKDRELVANKLLEEEDLIRMKNEKDMEHIPCSLCRDRQQLRRIKKQCAKCIKKPFKEFQICKFPEECSSCKVNLQYEETIETIVNLN